MGTNCYDIASGSIIVDAERNCIDRMLKNALQLTGHYLEAVKCSAANIWTLSLL